MRQLTGSLHLGQHLAAAVPHRGKTWLLVLAINALMTLGMSVVLVWLSIDRVNTAYFIDVQRSELKDKQSLRANLTEPESFGRKYGVFQADKYEACAARTAVLPDQAPGPEGSRRTQLPRNTRSRNAGPGFQKYFCQHGQAAFLRRL